MTNRQEFRIVVSRVHYFYQGVVAITAFTAHYFVCISLCVFKTHREIFLVILLLISFVSPEKYECFLFRNDAPAGR